MNEGAEARGSAKPIPSFRMTCIIMDCAFLVNFLIEIFGQQIKYYAGVIQK
jgi:hypothetical protein